MKKTAYTVCASRTIVESTVRLFENVEQNVMSRKVRKINFEGSRQRKVTPM